MSANHKKLKISENAYKIRADNLAILGRMVKQLAEHIHAPDHLAPRQRCYKSQPDFSLSQRETAHTHHRYGSKRPRGRKLLAFYVLSVSRLCKETIRRILHIRLSKRRCQGITLSLGLCLTGNGPALDSLERLHQMGVLRAAINQPEAVHSSNLHPSNVLVEALQAFATQEQVGLELTTLDPQQAPPPNLNILATDVGSHNQLRFTRPVMTIERFLVHHKATPATQLPSLSAAPRSNKSSALIGTRSQDPKALEVSQRHTVQPLGALIKADQPHIFSLFDQISGRTLPYTVASSHEYEIYRHFVDDLAARPIGAPHLFRWGLNKMESIALFSAADRFIEQLHKTGEINALKARFFWHDAALNNLERHIFLKRVRSRLPEYIAEFKSAGKKHDIDWRLLAAMAYQESHWDAQAVSPTGVRGLMMLTLSAAREVGITNRQLPASSIHGGAAYFKKQKARLPAFIPEPDRTWMALAAYNLGTSTVLRAIKRTQKHGENPTDWFAIQKHLSAFEQDIPTRHDIQYRKGAEQGLHYVKHIRLFYDLLQHPSVIENNITPTPINLAMARSVTP